jgi:transposase
VNKLYIGMDVSQNDVKVYILDQEGNEATQRFCVDNNPQGAETIVNNILKCCHSLSINKVFIGLESTSVYGWHLQFYLADHQGLKPFDPMIIL